MSAPTEAQRAVLQQQVEVHPHYASSRDGEWMYPAEEFEQKTGMKGISRDYAMPQGQDPKDVYLPLMKTEVERRIVAGYCQLAEEMGGASPQHLAAYRNTLGGEIKAYHQQLEQLQKSGTLDETERSMAQVGYGLQQKAGQLRGLEQLAQAGELTSATLEQMRQEVETRQWGEMQQCYGELENLNPDLKPLTSQIETRQQMWGVLLGVLSKFNVADVASFSIEGVTGVEARKNPAWVQRQEQIQQQTGTYMEWIPAPSTQLRILQQLRQRDGQSVASR